MKKQRPGSSDAEDPGEGERRPLLAGTSSGSAGRGSRGRGAAAPPQQAAPDSVVISVAPALHEQMGGGALRGPRQAGAAAAAAGSADGGECGDAGEARTCRICFETEVGPEDGDPDNPLISPCLCSGSSRFVHRRCLAQWRESSHRQDAAYQCEVCHFRYQFARAWWASLLGSPVTLGAVFLVSLSALVFVLGFIPFTGSTAADAWGPAFAHLANGVVGLGLLGLAFSLVLALMRAFGGAGLLWLPDPWCPAALCVDCNGGGLPMCIELGAGECGVAVAAFMGVLLLALGVMASAALTWHLLLLASQAALGKAQRMVENIGEAPPSQPLLRRARSRRDEGAANCGEERAGGGGGPRLGPGAPGDAG